MTYTDVTTQDDPHMVYIDTGPVPVTWEDIKEWLAAHGAPTKYVRSISFIPRGVSGDGPVQLRVEHFAEDAEGKRFATRVNGERQVAVSVTWVPLYRLP